MFRCLTCRLEMPRITDRTQPHLSPSGLACLYPTFLTLEDVRSEDPDPDCGNADPCHYVERR